MFLVYKPKGLFRIKAVQVTAESAPEVAGNLMGRVKYSALDGQENQIAGIDVPTLDGVKHFPVTSWIQRNDDNSLELIEDVEFQQKYERAVNRGSSQQ